MTTGHREIKTQIIEMAKMGGGWTNHQPACIGATENVIVQ